mgnify:CR=1 FL=1
MNSIEELLSKIKERPEMYIGRSSISCLKAFIDGWFYRDHTTIIDSELIDGFQSWIEQKYNINTSHSWCDIILFHSQDESKALKRFFEEFDEWKKTKDRNFSDGA